VGGNAARILASTWRRDALVEHVGSYLWLTLVLAAEEPRCQCRNSCWRNSALREGTMDREPIPRTRNRRRVVGPLRNRIAAFVQALLFAMVDWSLVSPKRGGQATLNTQSGRRRGFETSNT
jgi:hypothetical protein